MPEPSVYLQGFSVRQGMQFGRYVLANITISHSPVKEYRQYEYPIELTFHYAGGHASGVVTQSDVQDLIQQVQEYVGGTRVIYTQWGNPYECQFGTLALAAQQSLDFPQVVSLQALGGCTRSFVIPKKPRSHLAHK